MNPLFPLNEYIPDGEAHVFGDRVYLYGSHDAENSDRFCVQDYSVWSAPVSDLSGLGSFIAVDHHTLFQQSLHRCGAEHICIRPDVCRRFGKS